MFFKFHVCIPSEDGWERGKGFILKKNLIVLFLILTTSSLYAFNWSINDYIEKCSIVYQKQIYDTDRETMGYCMGVLKGTIAGIITTRSLETGKQKTPECLFNNKSTKFWEIQKDVLATMRLHYRQMKSAKKPNTANIAVATTLIELYPCLLD